jgi:hypothetical protein
MQLHHAHSAGASRSCSSSREGHHGPDASSAETQRFIRRDDSTVERAMGSAHSRCDSASREHSPVRHSTFIPGAGYPGTCEDPRFRRSSSASGGGPAVAAGAARSKNLASALDLYRPCTFGGGIYAAARRASRCLRFLPASP